MRLPYVSSLVIFSKQILLLASWAFDRLRGTHTKTDSPVFGNIAILKKDFLDISNFNVLKVNVQVTPNLFFKLIGQCMQTDELGGWEIEGAYIL